MYDLSNQVINLSEKELELKTYNTVGDVVFIKQFETISGKSVIDLSSQPNGIYIVKLKTSKGVISKRLVIK